MSALELLDATAICAELDSVIPQLTQLEILQSVDSTNRYLSDQSHLPSGTAVFSEQQTAGKGRLGRTWISPFGCNIYLSLLWQFPIGTDLSGLSLAVGVAVIQALENYGLSHIGLKWPNDIVYAQRKLGGILVEIKAGKLIIGIGLNVQMPNMLETDITQPWIDIRTISQQTPKRNRLAGLVLRELLLMLPIFQIKGLPPFYQEWPRMDVLYGQEVNIQTTQGMQQGIAQGIDVKGNLKILINGELKSFHSGEILSTRQTFSKNS